MPAVRFHISGAVLDIRVLLIWGVALVLMVGLYLFVQKSRMGKAMRATAQDPEAARMMGVEVDKVVDDGLLPRLGAGRRGRHDLRPVL